LLRLILLLARLKDAIGAAFACFCCTHWAGVVFPRAGKYDAGLLLPNMLYCPGQSVVLSSGSDGPLLAVWLDSFTLPFTTSLPPLIPSTPYLPRYIVVFFTLHPLIYEMDASLRRKSDGVFVGIFLLFLFLSSMEDTLWGEDIFW
jgi:hypothetical protein